MHYIFVALFYILIFIKFAAASETPKVEKEQMNVIRNAFYYFLKNIEYFDCKPLNGGLSSNTQYVCSVNNAKYVVRILNKSQDQREAEIATHKAAMKLGIAPILHYYTSNDENSIMIMDFIDDHTLWIPDSNKQELLDQLAEKLRKITQFDPAILTDPTPVDLFEKINQSHVQLKNLQGNAIKPMLNKALQIISLLNQQLKEHNNPTAFSHGDLHPRNIFFTNNNLIFIDWEMACMHHAWYDIVCCSIFLCLNTNDEHYLLTKYLQRTPSQADIHRFKTLKLMIRIDDVFSVLAFIQNMPESISIESIKSFTYYNTVFAQNSLQSSNEFLYAYAVSQLKEFFEEYNTYEQIIT